MKTFHWDHPWILPYQTSIDHKRDNNNKYRFMLNCVDCFSRYAWSVATTNKRGPTILEGLKQIVKENNNKYPAHLWVDQGSEFYNEEVGKYCSFNN